MKDVAEDPFINSTICHLIITSLVAQLVKNPPAMQEPLYNSWVRKISWRREKLSTPVFVGFPGDSDDKESACNAGDLDSIPGFYLPWEDLLD